MNADHETRVEDSQYVEHHRTAASNEAARAFVVASLVHRHQTDKSGVPYMQHVRRVAISVDGPDQEAVAWLHDVLEDSDLTADDLWQLGFSAATIRSVVLLTRTPPYDYRSYIEALKASGDAVAMAVKRADLRDHLRGNNWLAKAESMRERYESALHLLSEEPQSVAAVDPVGGDSTS